MAAPPRDLRLVSFDLDGTLIHPAIFNVVADALGFGASLEKTLAAYEAGSLSLEDAFEADVKHFIGRDVAPMREALAVSTKWTRGIPDAVELLKEAGYVVVLTTDQPDFLAAHVLDMGFDSLVCSASRVEHGIVRTVTPTFEKWPNLRAELVRLGIDASEAVHVGNGANDIPVFERVGWSIAVNPSGPAVSAAAAHTIPRLVDLVEVARHLLD